MWLHSDIPYTLFCIWARRASVFLLIHRDHSAVSYDLDSATVHPVVSFSSGEPVTYFVLLFVLIAGVATSNGSESKNRATVPGVTALH